MIGSVARNRQATAFAQALEHELDEATAADRTTGDGGASALPPAPERLPATGEGLRSHGGTASPSEGDRPAEPETLLGLAERLEALPRPELAPDVKAAQRAQLVAAMEAEFATPQARAATVPEQRGTRARKGAHRAPALGPLGKFRPRSRLTKGLAAGGLGVGVAASALGGVAAASSDALPGDSLYGLKRGMEDLRLDLAGDEADRGQVHLDHASTRMQEARRLMERTRGGAELDRESLGEVRRTLSGMRTDAAEGHRLLSSAYERDGRIAPMRSLSSFSSEHREGWAQLRDRLPLQLSDVGDAVSSVFDDMDHDVRPLAELISRSSGDTSREGGQGDGRADDSRTSPRPSSSQDSADSGAGDGEESGTPAPSGSDSRTGELIGGGGLLDPPSDRRGEPSSRHSGKGGKSLPDSEVTLPPILPEVLPELKGLPDDRK